MKSIETTCNTAKTMTNYMNYVRSCNPHLSNVTLFYIIQCFGQVSMEYAKFHGSIEELALGKF